MKNLTMSNLTDVGSLMNLYLDEIDPGEGIAAAEFLIQASADALIQKGGRNWIPLIVKEVGQDKYEVIANALIYAIAEAAGLDKVWCIIADASEAAAEISKILTGEIVPKINLSEASRDEIQAALQYLIEQPNTALKGVKLAIATNRIDEAPRQYWKTFEPIANLKCGITKGKKLEALKQVFYLAPQSLPDLITDPKLLQTLTASELKKLAKKRNLTGYTKLTKADLITALSKISNRE